MPDPPGSILWSISLTLTMVMLRILAATWSGPPLMAV